MAHSACVGISMSGKSTLMRSLCGDARARGIGVGVLDPNWDQWPADYQTDSLRAFLEWSKEARKCILILDECGETLARDPESVWFGTRSRHWGHRCTFGCHMWTQLLPVLRNQCTTAYVFNQPPDEAVRLARHYNDPILERASTLKQGEFIHKVPFQPGKIRKLRL